MKDLDFVSCAICGEPRGEDDGWFLLTENRWTDRLKILAWNEPLARAPGVYAVCGEPHVQQLVVHWMATGSLGFPFARTSIADRTPVRGPSRDARTESAEPDTSASQLIGELAVHRESLERILCESPESLAGILEALLSALTANRRPAQDEEELGDEAEIFAMSEA
jgi:hypothetical protein